MFRRDFKTFRFCNKFEEKKKNINNCYCTNGYCLSLTIHCSSFLTLDEKTKVGFCGIVHLIENNNEKEDKRKQTDIFPMIKFSRRMQHDL